MSREIDLVSFLLGAGFALALRWAFAHEFYRDLWRDMRGRST